MNYMQLVGWLHSGSELANYGRSKEKRNDAKLVVLALVVNIYGFIKYSAYIKAI
jgi:hypothetical protein